MNPNNLPILLETDTFVVINKPAGLLTLPDRYNKELNSCYHLLKSNYKEIFVVHRLDVGTSGCLLFAKDAAFHRYINIEFSEHRVKKKYIAILDGVLKEDSLRIDIPILSNPSNKGGVICSARGKESITHIKVLERYRIGTLIEAELETGRLHQLRAHCKAIGYPLLVDNVYGNKCECFVSSLKRRKYNLKKGEKELPIINRPTMHSKELGFIGVDGVEVIVEAPLPKDIRALISLLNKYCSFN